MGFVLKGWKRKQRRAWRSKDSCFGGKGKVRQKSGAVGSAKGSVVGFLYACPIVSNPALYQCCVLWAIFLWEAGRPFFSFVSKGGEEFVLYFIT